MNKLIILLLAFIKTMESHTIQTERLRVLYSELNRGLMLLCPDTGSPVEPNTNIDQYLIYWVNETSISNIPDNQISIASLILLTPALDDRFNFIFTRPYSELSCGYYFNNRYTRIKKWSLTYVEKADVPLKKTIDESYFKLISFNSSVFQINYQISNSTLFGLSKSRNIFKLDCEPNFDRPLIITTFIWLHYIKMENFKVTVDETLHMVANPGTVYPDDMQIFEGTDRKVEFITLIKDLYNSPDNSVSINLQCVSYIVGFNIGAISTDFIIIKRDSGSTGVITSSQGTLTSSSIGQVTTGPNNVGTKSTLVSIENSSTIKSTRGRLENVDIVLICVFSVVGIIIILSLAIFLIFTCKK
jgi:hypothetical protein